MKLSIIIPIYNVQDYIKDCLFSILTQNVSSSFFEIICVDDCGTDESIAIINEIRSKYEKFNFQLIKQENNMGLSAARNAGIKKATGKYIMFLDSDDYLLENSLLKIINSLIDADVYEGGVIDKVETSESIIKSIYPTKSFKVETGDEFFAKKEQLKEYMPMSCIRIYKRTFLINTGLFKEGIYFEDEEFTPRILLQAKKCECLPFPFYGYRRRDGSITTSIQKSNKWIKDYILIAESLLRLAEDHKEFKSYQILINRASNLIISLMKNVIYYNLNEETKTIVLKQVKEKKLYKIPMKSKSSLIKVQAILMRWPSIFLFFYKCRKGMN